MSGYKRSFRNYLLNPGFQLKFCAIVIGSTFLFSVAAAGFFYYSMSDAVDVLLEIFESVDIPPDQVSDFLSDHLQPIIIWTIAILFVWFGLIAAVVIVETHKVSGAEYAIQRHLKEVLQMKNYVKKIVLRKKDYLQDISDELNQLSDVLQATYGKSNEKKIVESESTIHQSAKSG